MLGGGAGTGRSASMRKVARLLSPSTAVGTTRSSVLRGVFMQAQCARGLVAHKSADRPRARSRICLGLNAVATAASTLPGGGRSVRRCRAR
jgi:hypothetical protein